MGYCVIAPGANQSPRGPIFPAKVRGSQGSLCPLEKAQLVPCRPSPDTLAARAWASAARAVMGALVDDAARRQDVV